MQFFGAHAKNYTKKLPTAQVPIVVDIDGPHRDEQYPAHQADEELQARGGARPNQVGHQDGRHYDGVPFHKVDLWLNLPIFFYLHILYTIVGHLWIFFIYLFISFWFKEGPLSVPGFYCMYITIFGRMAGFEPYSCCDCSQVGYQWATHIPF